MNKREDYEYCSVLYFTLIVYIRKHTVMSTSYTWTITYWFWSVLRPGCVTFRLGFLCVCVCVCFVCFSLTRTGSFVLIFIPQALYLVLSFSQLHASYYVLRSDSRLLSKLFDDWSENLLIADVYRELRKSEVGAETKQVLCGKPVPGEFTAKMSSWPRTIIILCIIQLWYVVIVTSFTGLQYYSYS